MFIICFALDEQDSLDKACNEWRKEIIERGPIGVPKILVGCRKDIRDEKIEGFKN